MMMSIALLVCEQACCKPDEDMSGTGIDYPSM
jgi:hypothetical protein